MSTSYKTQRGFTLIELLLVIGIIAILASIVIVAINPTKQLGDARNAQRRSDVNTILNAVSQYTIDHNGDVPGDIPAAGAAAEEICRTQYASSDTECSGMVSLRVLSGAYVVGIPNDPQVSSTSNGTNYWISQDASGRITVTASGAELGATISVQR